MGFVNEGTMARLLAHHFGFAASVAFLLLSFATTAVGIASHRHTMALFRGLVSASPVPYEDAAEYDMWIEVDRGSFSVSRSSAPRTLFVRRGRAPRSVAVVRDAGVRRPACARFRSTMRQPAPNQQPRL